jgi:hypothetical protein
LKFADLVAKNARQMNLADRSSHLLRSRRHPSTVIRQASTVAARPPTRAAKPAPSRSSIPPRRRSFAHLAGAIVQPETTPSVRLSDAEIQAGWDRAIAAAGVGGSPRMPLDDPRADPTIQAHWAKALATTRRRIR